MQEEIIPLYAKPVGHVSIYVILYRYSECGRLVEVEQENRYTFLLINLKKKLL